MEENVFDSVDAIDAKLDEEFGEVANEPEETPVEPEIEETQVEEEKVEEQTEPEVVGQPEETEGEEKVTKKDHAFAELRAENGNLKKERDGYKADSDYLKELASSYGYDDVSKFQEAIREAKYQKEAEAKGYDYDLYKKTMEQERRIAELEKEREQEITDRKLERFKNALDKAVETYGIEEQEIFDRLENSGVSVEDVLSISNPKLLIDGLLVDKIKNDAKQSQIKDLQNLQGLVEDKNEQTGSVNEVTIESLLKDDLAKYKRDNFFD